MIYGYKPANDNGLRCVYCARETVSASLLAVQFAIVDLKFTQNIMDAIRCGGFRDFEHLKAWPEREKP